MQANNNKISTAAWKSSFLRLLDSHAALRSLVNESRNGDRGFSADALNELNAVGAQLLASCGKRELVQTCQYHNNRHLIHFWKWFLAQLNTAVAEGSLTSDFPLIAVESENETLSGNETPKRVRPDFFESLFFWRSPHDDSRRFCKVQGKERFWHEWSECRHDPLEQLLGRLHMLHDLHVRSTTALYNRFLQEHKQKGTSCWDDYRIHYVLDFFLYRYPNGQQRYGATFDKIFFNNNRLELEAWLSYHREAAMEFSLEDAAAFLERQRKYYIQLATHISIERNALLNNRRKLMYFDPEQGIAVVPDADSQTLSRIRRELVEEAGMIEMNGCPFAKSRGVARNAALEVFQHFDTLMLKLVDRWVTDARGQNHREYS